MVCDGRSRASLQVCRALAGHNHEVHVGEAFQCASFFSSQVTRNILYPDPDDYPEFFYSFILNYIIKNKISFIFPIRDSTNAVLCKYKHQFSSFCKVFLPNYQEFLLIQRKDTLMKLASKYGIIIPRTIYGAPYEKLNFIHMSNYLGLPIIAKPILSSGSRGIYLINNQSDFTKFGTKNIDTKNYIFQEFILHGGAVGVYVLYNKGKLVTYNTHVRIREYPHSGGPSTLRRSGRNQICEHFAFKLLNKIKWHGMAMVEFRIHKLTKVPYMMEVNPRLWGSLAVDIHSGVDFPNLVIEQVYGPQERKAENNRKSGVVVRWLFLGDILWLITHPQKISALKTFLNFKDQKFDILDSKDPLPVVGAILEGFLSFFKRNRREHAFGRDW